MYTLICRAVLVYSAAASYRSPTNSVTNLSDYDRGIRKFPGLAVPLDVSPRTAGVISGPTTSAVARVRDSRPLLRGTDNVRAASSSTDSIPLPETIGGLAAAFEFPGHINASDAATLPKWRRRFGDVFKDDTLLAPAAATSSSDYSHRA